MFSLSFVHCYLLLLKHHRVPEFACPFDYSRYAVSGKVGISLNCFINTSSMTEVTGTDNL